jgi:hypothetical protein
MYLCNQDVTAPVQIGGAITAAIALQTGGGAFWTILAYSSAAGAWEGIAAG